jgi:predicted enzyme related to lactoylglutathione lyase
MATRLAFVVIDATDPSALARFWSAVLGWPIYEEPDSVVVDPPDDASGVPLDFGPVPEPKTTKNRIHLDLATTSAEHQAAEVERLKALGARPVDIGQGDAVPWVVLADPEGNELCVLDPRPEYMDTVPVAAIVIDCQDPAAVASFWAEAAGWSKVREGDGWASLRSPLAKGPYLEFVRVPDLKTVKNRVHTDVAPFVDDDQAAEVERLVGLGARRIDIGQGDAVPWVVLADPEGNEFCVLTPR